MVKSGGLVGDIDQPSDSPGRDLKAGEELFDSAVTAFCSRATGLLGSRKLGF